MKPRIVSAALCVALVCAGALSAGQANAQSADSTAFLPGSFEKVVLVEGVSDGIEMAIAPDNSVFFIERQGSVLRWDVETETTSTIGFIPVNNVEEDGMLGITLDPDYEDNKWVYIYYSPEGPEEKNVLSRFTFDGERLAYGSQVDILDVPTQRTECCHTGGSLAFGPDGNLFLSTGDNTNPFASDGFAPIDARPGRDQWDARRSSGNTNDLRGKILRIAPQPDGSYTIPEGNLFPGGQGGLPEIYTMGHRNPYRIAVDQETGWLYWGEVGPDAGAALEGRGPAGHDEFNRAKQAGNFGWPLFIGDNKPYSAYNFEAQQSGAPFDPNRPVNDSPNNTGARVLPPAQPALMWYPYGPSEEFPDLGVGGRTAQGGPIYHYDPATVHEHGLPEYFDNTWIIYEWARNWIKEAKLDEQGNVRDINTLFPDYTFIRPMDVEMGADGRLYVMEWGDEFWGINENARIVRLDYYGSPNRPPVVEAEAAVASGADPMNVRFSASGSRSPQEGATLSYAWDFDGNGTVDATTADAAHTFAQPGRNTAEVTVTDNSGLSTTRQVEVVAGNTRPQVTITSPVNGGFFDYGQPIRYEVQVSDAEDGQVSGASAVVQPIMGRDTHELELQPQYGNSGAFTVNPYRYTHWNNQYVAIEARYADNGADGAEALTGVDRIILQPRRKQAEHTVSREEITQKMTGSIKLRDEALGLILEAKDASVLAYAPVNLQGINAVTFRVKPEAGGTMELRLDAPNGQKLGEVAIPSSATMPTVVPQPATGDVTTHDEEMHRLENQQVPEGWQDLTVPVTDPGGAHTLYLVFHGQGDEVIAALDWLQFDGVGIAGR